VAGEHDADQVRMAFLGFAKELSAIHAGHSHVGHDDVESVLGEEGERFFSALHELGLELVP
jgi:hypothetical protein